MDTIYFDERGQLLSGERIIGSISINVDDYELSNCKSILPFCDKPKGWLSVDNRKDRTQTEFQQHVQYLKGLPQPEQRTKEWYEMRESRLTASDLAGAIGDSKYEKPFDILVKKCNFGKPFKGNSTTEWGVKYEPIAASLYEKRNKTKLIEFGLLAHPEIPFLGASPDGISPDGVMLEIKCPKRREITGEVPPHYWIQMQLQLEVCDLERCDFEECKFSEYFSQRAFAIDRSSSEPEHMIAADGQEKGILIEFYDNAKGKNGYKYCPNDLTISRAIDWAVEEENALEQNSSGNYLIARKYWKLEKYSCVCVSRDRDWFEKALPKITAFWREVCYYRTQPEAILYADHRKLMKNDDTSDDEPEDPHGQLTNESCNVFVESDNEQIEQTTTANFTVKNPIKNMFVESDDESENVHKSIKHPVDANAIFVNSEDELDGSDETKTNIFDLNRCLSNLKLENDSEIILCEKENGKSKPKKPYKKKPGKSKKQALSQIQKSECPFLIIGDSD